MAKAGRPPPSIGRRVVRPRAAYAAFGRNDPSVLFGAMDPAIDWKEAEGNPLADRNPYVGPHAVGAGVFARLVAAIDNFTALPTTFIDGGDHVVVLGRYGGTMKKGGTKLDAPFCHVYRLQGDKAVMFQQYTDTAQWARLMGSHVPRYGTKRANAGVPAQ